MFIVIKKKKKKNIDPHQKQLMAMILIAIHLNKKGLSFLIKTKMPSHQYWVKISMTNS